MSLAPPTGPQQAQPAPLPPGTPPQWAPTHDYYWDGSSWALVVPATSPAPVVPPLQAAAPVQAQASYPAWLQPVPKTQITVSAGTAFKLGFFGVMGVWVASLIPTIILWLLAGAVFASCVAAINSRGANP